MFSSSTSPPACKIRIDPYIESAAPVVYWYVPDERTLRTNRIYAYTCPGDKDRQMSCDLERCVLYFSGAGTPPVWCHAATSACRLIKDSISRLHSSQLAILETYKKPPETNAFPGDTERRSQWDETYRDGYADPTSHASFPVAGCEYHKRTPCNETTREAELTDTAKQRRVARLDSSYKL